MIAREINLLSPGRAASRLVQHDQIGIDGERPGDNRFVAVRRRRACRSTVRQARQALGSAGRCVVAVRRLRPKCPARDRRWLRQFVDANPRLCGNRPNVVKPRRRDRYLLRADAQDHDSTLVLPDPDRPVTRVFGPVEAPSTQARSCCPDRSRSVHPDHYIAGSRTTSDTSAAKVRSVRVRSSRRDPRRRSRLPTRDSGIGAQGLRKADPSPAIHPPTMCGRRAPPHESAVRES